MLSNLVEQITLQAIANGLAPGRIRYEIVPVEFMDSLAARLLPACYSHWSFGKAYLRNRVARSLNSWQPYEQVLNTDPCYVFLCAANSQLENTLAIAHAVAHNDFFRNNRHCSDRPVSILPIMRAAVQRIHGYEHTYSQAAVEAVLDAALALQPHVDLHGGCNDLLYYLIDKARCLAPWERDIICVVRDQALYLQPQQNTQIINEGWACYWHTKLIRQLHLSVHDATQFAIMQSRLLEDTPQNPYLLGFTAFHHLACGGNDAIFAARASEDDVSFLAKYAPTRITTVSSLHVPLIQVQDNLMDTGTLSLVHAHDGRDLDMQHANGVLQHIARLWRARVTLRTSVQGQQITLTVE